MRKSPLLMSVLALILCGQQAPAQETVLTGVLSSVAPDAQVSWDRGASQAGQETYEGLFVGQGRVRVRGDLVRVSPNGPTARIEADRLVLNLDGDERFAVEVSGLSLTIPAAALRAFRDGGPVPDLCFEAGAGVEARGVRIVRDLPSPNGRPVRAEARADLIRLTQEIRKTGSGCEVTFTGRADGAQESRSDKSGFRLDLFELTLTLPGNLETLTSVGAPDLTIALRFGGAVRQVPGGASVAAVRDGSADARITAIGAVPVLTALLRTRGGTTEERLAATLSALTPAEARLSGAVNGATLLVEALLPSGLISGLSRASLTSVIGDYAAELDLRGGGAAIFRARSEPVGIGLTTLAAELTLAPRRPDAPDLGLGTLLDRVVPDVRLRRAELVHRDGGLLRAIELISGSPVSVLAAIFLEDGQEAVPEAWRPAARRAVTELARFFSLTPRGEGALLRLSAPQDLSVPETYRLLTLRPDLADQLIVTEITQAPPKGP